MEIVILNLINTFSADKMNNILYLISLLNCHPISGPSVI